MLAGTGRCWTGICILGLTLDELAEVARANTSRKITVLRDLNENQFREHMRRSNDPGRRYVVNFSREQIFGAGVGHHSPIGGYLEADDQDTSIRYVWLWVLLLFFGPMAQAISKQWHRRVETDIQGRLQALLSQLVFEHSLRIRIPTGPSHATLRPLQDADNFTGKIYNLISADLDRMAEGVDFLSVGQYTCFSLSQANKNISQCFRPPFKSFYARSCCVKSWAGVSLSGS